MRRCFILSFVTLLFVWMIGFMVFGFFLPHTTHQPTQKTDAIVVLTGGNNRLKVAIELMQERIAKKLFISGVHHHVDLKTLLSLHPELIDHAAEVDLGYASKTTIENAEEVSRWMLHNGFTTLRLVTSHYHMPRSLLEMQLFLPKNTIVSHPVLSEKFSHYPWWYGHNAWVIFCEYNKYLEALGRFMVNKGIHYFR